MMQKLSLGRGQEIKVVLDDRDVHTPGQTKYIQATDFMPCFT